MQEHAAEPTCSETGSDNYTYLGDDALQLTFTVELPTIDHSYVNGVCEFCGQADPNGGTGIDTGSGISVFESTGDPVITSFRFYQDVNGTEYVDLTNTTNTLTVDYNGSTDPYKFVITVDEPELINHIYVNGNAQDENHQMEATYDSIIGAFVAEGYFDENNIFYQPEDIKLEYSVKSSAPKVGENINWNEMVPYLNELNNASITVDEKGNTNSGIIDFSGVADGINDMALDYVIKTIDSSTGTKLQELKHEYETAAGILSYVVLGLDDSKYIVYLDQNDPHTWKMLLSDGLDIAEKAIEIQMTFEDPTSSQYINMVDALDNLGKVSTVANTAYKAYKINKETEELHSEIDRCTTIKEADKDRAHEKAQELHHDKMQFMLLTVTLPILVTTGAVMGPAPAMLFSAIIGAMTITSNIVYDYRVGGILGAEAETDWYPSIATYEGRCGEHVRFNCIAFFSDYYWNSSSQIWTRDIIDSQLFVFGSGSTYDSSDCFDAVIPDTFGFNVKWARKLEISGISRIGSGTFAGLKRLEEVSFSSTLREIGTSAFAGCEKLDNVHIPSSVNTICERAFLYCSGLKHLIISNGVQTIEEAAFEGCTSLENVTIPESIIDIPKRCFSSCGFKSITIREGIRTIGLEAFKGCTHLAEIVLPESLEIIGAECFAGTALQEITVPKNFQSIAYTSDGDNSYSHEYITVLNDGSIIKDGTFGLGNNLTKIVFENGVKTIPNRCCAGAINLTEVQIPDSVTTIEEAAFQNCYRLQEISLPRDLIDIGMRAFYDCPLKHIKLPLFVKTIGTYAFWGCECDVITIPSSVKIIEEWAFGWSESVYDEESARNITVYFAGDQPVLGNIFGAVFNGRKVNAFYPRGNDTWNRGKPDMGAYSITWYPYDLPNVFPTPDCVLPIDLKSIDNEAFISCSFGCVQIPFGCIKIGDKAFAESTRLKAIYIPSSVTIIAADAFAGVTKDLLIIGASGSEAEDFAKAHNYSFLPE